MFAIIETGGKQYKVAENDVLKIEKLDGDVGNVIKFERVLSLGDDKSVKVGTPNVEGAVVSAEVLEQKKDKKVLIFKKKRRQGYKRKQGHRQQITVVRILDVSGKGAAKKAAPKKEATKKDTAEPKSEAKAKAPKKETAAKEAPAKKEAAPKATKKADENAEN